MDRMPKVQSVIMAIELCTNLFAEHQLKPVDQSLRHCSQQVVNGLDPFTKTTHQVQTLILSALDRL